MPSRPRSLRANVVAARQRLAEGREKLHQRHQRGSPGIQVCRAMTELFDTLVLDLYRAALADLHEDHERGWPRKSPWWPTAAMAAPILPPIPMST